MTAVNKLKIMSEVIILLPNIFFFFTGFINEYVVKPVYTEPKVQGSDTIFNLNSRIFFFNFQDWFQKKLGGFLEFRMGSNPSN